jgi:hypothetical protein
MCECHRIEVEKLTGSEPSRIGIAAEVNGILTKADGTAEAAKVRLDAELKKLQTGGLIL